ncbi:MAG TPA: hypothetical protein VIJ22_00715 [Polyangiaceae bacterium]
MTFKVEAVDERGKSWESPTAGVRMVKVRVLDEGREIWAVNV